MKTEFNNYGPVRDGNFRVLEGGNLGITMKGSWHSSYGNNYTANIKQKHWYGYENKIRHPFIESHI